LKYWIFFRIGKTTDLKPISKRVLPLSLRISVKVHAQRQHRAAKFDTIESFIGCMVWSPKIISFSS